MSDRVAEAGDAILAVLRGADEPQSARSVLDAAKADSGCSERETRAAVWELIDRGAVRLTRERELALWEDA